MFQFLVRLIESKPIYVQGLRDSGIGSQGVTNSINMMTKVKKHCH